MPPKRHLPPQESSRPRKFFRTAAQVAAYSVAGDVGAYAAGQVFDSMRPAGGTSYGQGTFTTEKKRSGKKVSRKSTKWTKSVARASVSRIVFGLQDASAPAFGGYGKWFLRNYFDTRALTDAGNGGYYLPIHLWDVSAVANSTVGSETVVDAQCGYRIGLTTETTGRVPRHRTLGDPLTTVTGPSTATSASSVVRTGSLLRGVRAKIMFYCPLARPARVKVQLVQILDDSFHPSKNSDNPFNPIDGRTDQGNWKTDNSVLPLDSGTAHYAAANFWSDLAYSYCTSPVNIGTTSSSQNKALKVLKSTSFVLQPKESTDATATTYHMVDWFMNFNRKQVYNWENTQQRYGIQGGDLPQENTAQSRNCVSPKARLYLMIMADAAYASAAADPPAIDSTNSPSYDISIRTYHDDIV